MSKRILLIASKSIDNLLFIAGGIVLIYYSKKEKEKSVKRAMMMLIFGILSIIIGITEFFIKF